MVNTNMAEDKSKDNMRNGGNKNKKNTNSKKKSKKIDKLPPKDNFSEWYHELIQRAEIMDIRYPVKGLYVWFPFGFKIRKAVYGILRNIMDREHDEVYFPALIPEKELGKEGEHIKGFENEVYWVTHGGKTPLDVKLALRPTSETAMYPMFKLWVRSHADLPIKIYQVVNTFRYETKHTRPLIRLREITSFKEAHTVHATFEDAEEQVKKAINYYKEFYNKLAIPYIICKRPEWDKFPGAEYTLAFDTVMPDGKTLQIGTVHNLGNNFAKTFDIKYELPNGEHSYVYQTCYGISERCIAALISIHGDDNGLVLPFEVSPVQIVIIPILYKGKEEEVLKFAKDLGEKLSNYRVVVDESDDRPGAKYYNWELKGAAVRIEIGPKEVEKNMAMVSFRDERNKFEVSIDEIPEKILEWDESMLKRLYSKAAEIMYNKIKFSENIQEVGEWVENGGIALAYLCKSEECGEVLDKYGEVLGELIDISDVSNLQERNNLKNLEKCGKCIVCGKKGKLNVIAKTY